MKEIGKLWLITRRFYLMILGIVLVIAVWSSICLFNYDGIAFTGKSVETTITEKLSNQSDNTRIMPAELSEIADNKRDDMTLLGTFWTFAGIILMLFLRYIAYVDGRTREFQAIWPISMRKRILFDYVAMLSILIIGWATEVVIFMTAGNHYNKVAERILMERSMDTSAFSDAALFTENKTFLVLMGLFLLYEIIFYTFLFLGINMVQNPILGFPVCFIVYGTVQLFISEITIKLWEYEIRGGILSYPDNESGLLKFLNGLSELTYPDLIYEQLEIYCTEGRAGYEEYLSQVNLLNVEVNILILVLLELVMIGTIIWLSKRKELSEGKLLFSRSADIGFGACFLLFLYLMSTLVFSNFTVLIGIGFAGVIGFILIRTRGIGVKPISGSKKWEVK